eukprot:gene10635-12417_t
MSRKRAKVSSKSTVEKTQFDLEEEELMLRVDQLSSGQNDMRNETTDLKSSLGELLDKYISREESFQRTVKEFQEHCVQKAQKMEEEANQVRADAATVATALIATAKVEIDEWEAEKKKLSVIKTFERKVKLDVGEIGRHAMHLDEEGYYFIDRDGTHFRYILNYLRSPETFVCDLSGGAMKELKSECDYYGILDKIFHFVKGGAIDWSVQPKPSPVCTGCRHAC